MAIKQTNGDDYMTNEMPQVTPEIDYNVLPPLPVENYDLRPRELLAAQMMIINDSLPRKSKTGKARLTQIEIAEQLGVSRETLHEYRTKPEFQRYVRDATQIIANDYVIQALTNMKALADGSITGTPSIGANMFFLNHAGLGITKQEHSVTVNQGGTVSQVTDEEIARIIARAESDEVEVIDMPTEKLDAPTQE